MKQEAKKRILALVREYGDNALLTHISFSNGRNEIAREFDDKSKANIKEIEKLLEEI